MELVDTVEELEAAANDPDAFVAGLLSAVGDIGRQMAMARLRKMLKPKLEDHGLAWEDAMAVSEPAG